MSMTDYRAMCAELLAAIQLYTKLNPAASDMSPFELTEKLMDAMAATDAALAQPVAEGPTDEEIADWHDQCADLTRLGEADHYWAFDLRSDEVAGVVRAALARFGHPTPQPVAVSERLPWDELCWWFEPDEDDGYGGMWTLLRIRGGTTRYTHWLPSNALPTPEANDY